MRRRIVVLAVLAAALSTTLFGVPLAIAAGQYLVSGERAAVERVADLTAVAVAPALARGQVPVNLPPPTDESFAGLYDAGASRLLGTGPVTGEAVVRRALGGQVAVDDDDDGSLVVAVPVVDGEEVIGIVRAGTDYTEVHWQVAGTSAAMAAVGAAAVFVTWLLARRQAQALARPLDALVVTARRLGEGDFTVRTRASGIPEIDATGAALDVTAARLDALLARERAFSAHASHQLRTPLTAMRLDLEAALAGPDPRDGVGRALLAADRLERTIEDLLVLARQEGSPGDVLDLGQLLGEALAGVAPLLAGAGRSAQLDVEPDLPDVRATWAAVRQVVGVLLDNAVVHGQGTVRVRARDAGGVVAVDVGDDGAGPPDPEDLLTGPRPVGHGGHGIGLTLARQLSESQGGRLVLRRASPPVFSLLLPGDVG